MPIPKHYTPAELSERLGVTEGELATMRWKETGPRFVKIGSRVRYPEPEVEAFLASETYSGAREAKRMRRQRITDAADRLSRRRPACSQADA